MLNAIALLASQNRQIVLHDLVETRFGRRPCGWPDWEVILLVARLVRKGESNLAMDGSTLTPDRLRTELMTPNKWRRMILVKRKSVDKGVLQKARTLAKEVFGKIAPDREDALAAHLRQRLEAWRDRLNQHQALAQTGNYPGMAEIGDGLAVLAKLLAEHESFELITRFLERENDLLDLSDDIHDLDNFYHQQRPTWDRLRKAYEQFRPNRKWLDRDEEGHAALQRMQTILSSAAPYTLIKEAEGLIRTVTGINDRIVRKSRGKALARIDAHIQKVTDELDAVQADSGLRNQSLYPLQQLRSQVERQESLAHIFQVREEAGEEADAALARIEEETRKRAGEPGGGSDKPYVKKRRVVQVASLSSGSYLESQQDVEAFLAKLRQALEAAIAADERIEIR